LALKHGRIDGEKLGRQYHYHAAKYHRREIWAERYSQFIESI
jgi:hypothetical protein